MSNQMKIFEQRAKDYIGIFPNAERRFIVSSKIEYRKADDGSAYFGGYAAKFNSWSNDLGGFRELIAPGFFDNVLKQDVRALFNHDPNFVLGRSTAGTLTYSVDEMGLRFDYKDPETSWSRDLAISINRGDVNQCSFAFSLNDTGDNWRKTDTGYERTLLAGGCSDLYDVSVVTYPAYSDTSVASTRMRSGIDEAKKRFDMEEALKLEKFNRDQFEKKQFFKRKLK